MRSIFLLLAFLSITISNFCQLTVKDTESIPNELIQIIDEGNAGSILIPPLSSIVTNTDKLYNLSGNLYWNGNALGISSSAGGWTDDGIVVRLTTGTDKVGIGTSAPNSFLSVGGNGDIDGAISGISSRERGRGIYGFATNNAFVTNYGGYFEAAGINGRGAYGFATNTGDGTNYGGYFEAAGINGRGVYGSANNTGNGTTYGGYFKASSTDGRAVYGHATNNNNVDNYGGYFVADGESGRAVFGVATDSGSASNYGGFFRAKGTSGIGVYGEAINGDVQHFGGVFNGSGTNGTGVWGVVVNGQDGYGVWGHSNNNTNGHGVHGYASGTNSYAGYFDGRLHCTGTLSKAAGSFKIDHPLDPSNKILYHSFVESPDMMNIYNGNVILNSDGEAWIELADWFEALNMEFRYQLTPIGSPGPNLYISEEISGNQFKIAGGASGMKVSWQVTGIRKDAYANANRIPVEEIKNENERGKYLHPEAFNKPLSMGVDYNEDIEKIILRLQR